MITSPVYGDGLQSTCLLGFPVSLKKHGVGEWGITGGLNLQGSQSLSAAPAGSI